MLLMNKKLNVQSGLFVCLSQEFNSQSTFCHNDNLWFTQVVLL